ncbi:MAG: OmpA family protein [Bacteroidetes bacterium]|nr:OmpA family protein [Bacteroidota bacterium]MBS1973867.1 OmpA family protein [Bacteroidota bacterium]
MASKKYFLFSVILCLLVSTSFAQIGGSYDLRDSSLIPAKRMPQHEEFLNNAYPFPAKPRNEWEIGLKGGLPFASSDVRYWGPTGGFGIHVRKALGYVFSIRGEFDWLRMKGLNFQPSSDFGKNTAWMAPGTIPGANGPSVNPYQPGVDDVFYNYRTTVNELSVQGVVTLNNLRFHRSKTGFNVYGFGGIGLSRYHTFVNTHDASGSYEAAFNNLVATAPPGYFSYSNRKAIKKQLKSIMDGKFDTPAQTDPGQPTLGGWPIYPVAVVGAGAAFKINNKFNLAVEYKYTLIKTDLLDGQQWQENGATQTAQTRDYDSYSFFSVGLNYNIGKKAVEPLWWLNPLDYAYSEINAPRHMKLPKPILDDADGDGVTDQFDLEPNTPKGCPVDTHGVSRDTDGDGVPDCKDKELITPTQCQPVDADGVGKCPDPQCCKDLRAYIDSTGGGHGKCSIGDLPSITFKGRGVSLSKDAKALLASIADKMRNNPNCKVAVVGYGESSKSAQQLSWDRVNEVIKYLVEKEGISLDRFIFRYGQTNGDENTIDLKDGTGEEGPNTVPAPHPNLRRKN